MKLTTAAPRPAMWPRGAIASVLTFAKDIPIPKKQNAPQVKNPKSPGSKKNRQIARYTNDTAGLDIIASFTIFRMPKWITILELSSDAITTEKDMAANKYGNDSPTPKVS